MGEIVDSCKQHVHCCNEDEDKKENSETDEYSENSSDEGSQQDEESHQDEEDNNRNLDIPNDIINMKVKLNDLVMEHQTSPWIYYKKLLTLGSGTYGTVKKVCLIKNQLTIRAMKIISKENIMEGVDNSKLIDEITILKKLDHPNIMKIYECFVDKDNFYIISDFCDQGDLLGKLEKLGKMNEIVVKFIMDQVFNAVAYLHSKNVLHGDIKLENILLYTASKNKGRRFTSINMDINHLIDLQKEINKSQTFTKRSKNYVNDMLNYEVKLIDFGCSKYFANKKKHKRLSGIIGSTLYCSPEVVDDLYDEKCDEWSCGVLMYMLLCGEPPFQGNSEEEIFEKIKKCDYNFKPAEFKDVSDNCKDLIRKLLEPKKRKRIKASEALRHPFFTTFFNPNKAMTQNKDLNILKNLINYKKGISKFHETIFAFLCNNFISIDEEKKLRAVFRYVDKEEQNLINKKNLKLALNEININISEDEYNNIFKQLDGNQNDIVEYQEFLRATCDKNTLLTEENLKNTFLALSGGEEKEFITANDIKKFIFHDSNIQEKIFNEYLEQFGMKIDDKINFEQFYDMIKNDTKLNEKENDKNNNINNEKNNVGKKNSNNELNKIKNVPLKMTSIEENEEYTSEK